MHTVLITGCATGFGHLLARRLLDLGHRVVATDVAPPEGWAALLGAPHPALLALQLDVRDADSVHRSVCAALAWSPVDVLVNNAGYAVFGSQEETPLDHVRDMFEVNVFGAARVTRALLPSLRAQAGTVVQLSSVAGRTVFPESGFYAASKYALEAMSEALFQETCTFGVKLRILEPGSFATRFQERAAAASPPAPPASPYAALRPSWDARKREVLEEPQDPELVVAAILAGLDDPRPFLRLPVGPDAVRILEVRDALGPDGWSRFAGDRAGLCAPHGPGEVLAPAEVLDLWSHADRPPPADVAAQLATTAWAAARGHLGHWRTSAEGEQALAVLAHLPPC